MLIRHIKTATVLTAVAILLWQGWGQGQSSSELMGQGKRATQKISLSAGIHVFHMRHDGAENFSIRPFGTDGRTYVSLVNTIGQFDGSAVFATEKESTYILNVDANGRWWISIEGPKKIPSKREFRGHGQQATEMISLERGLYVFEMKHNGTGNFSVRPFNASGRSFPSLANEIGPFDGSSVASLAEGDYLFQVGADGDWEILVRKQ